MNGSMAPLMASDIKLKTVGLVFAVVLALYASVFAGIEYRRHKHGPWNVEFVTDAAGQPAIRVAQAHLGIGAVEITFAGERLDRTNLQERVACDRVLRPLPFGKRIFEDLTFLPGTETVDFFGHEVELLPRVLIVNRREIPWQSGQRLELHPAEKLPPRPPTKKKSRLFG